MHLQPFGSFGPRGLPTRQRKQMDMIYMDMSKAYDKVNHLPKKTERGSYDALI